MSTRDVDRLIGAYLDLEAPPNPPAGLLDRTLELSSRTRQRPGWLGTLKGTHMSTTARLARVPQMRAAPILILVGLLVAVLAAALLLVGAQTRLPPPIGLARSGLIAYDSDGKLYVAIADGSGARPLEGQGQEISVSPMFSPDGRAIAYWSQPSRDTDYSLWIRAADGSNGRLIAGPFHGRPTRFGQTPAWSPDSRRLAFSAAESGDPRLYVVDAAGGNATPLGDDRLERSQPAWSPDGSRLAYFGRLEGDLYGFDTGIYVMNADGTAERKVSSSSGSSQYGSLQHPKWSPDGQGLLYQVGGEENWFEIAVAKADGSGEDILLPGEIEELFPVWSPDGAQIAFQRRVGSRDVGPYQSNAYVMRPDGSDVRKVSDHLLGFGAVCWSPDGRQLLGRTPAFNAVVVLGVDGSAEPVEIPAPAAGGLASPIDWAEFPCAWQRLAP